MRRVVGVKEIFKVNGPTTLLRRQILAVVKGIIGGVFFGHMKYEGNEKESKNGVLKGEERKYK